uniref:Uncharacterized protein n=1 Tax=Anguilla anguilla TaxID=7936 RepID=A0A0E9QGF1_ANGAN
MHQCTCLSPSQEHLSPHHAHGHCYLYCPSPQNVWYHLIAYSCTQSQI